MAAELASKMNRWAGYNYTVGGYAAKINYGKQAGAYEDVDLVNVAKTFCPMIKQQYVDIKEESVNTEFSSADRTIQYCELCLVRINNQYRIILQTNSTNPYIHILVFADVDMALGAIFEV